MGLSLTATRRWARTLGLLSLGVVWCASTVVRGQDAASKEKPGEKVAQGEKPAGDLSELLDANGDGVVSDEEARQAVADVKKKSADKDERGKSILDALDSNKDGMVDDKEATEGVARERTRRGGNASRLSDTFARMDDDKDGFVTADEFRKYTESSRWGGWTERRYGPLFAQLDGDRDSKVSAAELQLGVDLIDAQEKAAEEARDKALQLARATLARLDRDKDSKVSEAESKRDAALKQVFVDVDTDKDGYATETEMHAYLKKVLPPQPDPNDRRGRSDRGGRRSRGGPGR